MIFLHHYRPPRNHRSHRHKSYTVIAMLIIALLTAGCNSSGTDAVTDPEPTSASTDTSTPANYLLSTYARIADSEDRSWQSTLEVASGDTVEIQLEYANYDTVNHHDVILRVALPIGMTYIPGTTQLFNTVYPDGYDIAEDDLVLGGGLNLGLSQGYSSDDAADTATDPASNVFLRFRVTIDELEQNTLLVVRVNSSATREDTIEPTLRDDFVSFSAIVDYEAFYGNGDSDDGSENTNSTAETEPSTSEPQDQQSNTNPDTTGTGSPEDASDSIPAVGAI